MKKFLIPAFMVAMLGFASCADEEKSMDVSVPAGTEIEATFEDVLENEDLNGLSKTTLVSGKFNFEGNENGVVYTDAKEGAISFKNSGKGTSMKFAYASKVPTTGKVYFSMIPSTGLSSVDFEKKVASIEFPTVQTAKAGNFSSNGHLYASCSSKATSFAFKTLNSFLIVKNAEAPEVFESITLSSVSPIAGAYTVELNSTMSEPAQPVDGQTANSIVLNGQIVAGNNYYIALAPGLVEGFTLTAKAGDNIYTFSFDKSVTFVKNATKSITPKWELVKPEPNYEPAEFGLSFTNLFDLGYKIPTKIVFDTKKDVYNNLYRVHDENGNPMNVNTGYDISKQPAIEFYLNEKGGSEYYFLCDEDIHPYSAGIFAYCNSVEEMVLDNFNTKDLKNLDGMFEGFSSLKTIYVSDKFVISEGASTDGMFNDCTSLVGEKGTKGGSAVTEWDYAGKDFAHVDGEDGKPGFFTQIGHEPFSGLNGAKGSHQGFDNSGWINNPDEPYFGN